MKKVIEHIGLQEPHIAKLIIRMIEATQRGRKVYSVPQGDMSTHEVNWLRKNEFEPEFNNDTMEWEVPLT